VAADGESAGPQGIRASEQRRPVEQLWEIQVEPHRLVQATVARGEFPDFVRREVAQFLSDRGDAMFARCLDNLVQNKLHLAAALLR